MIRATMTLIRLLLFSLFGLAGPALAQTSDIEAIRDVQARQADAWNRHDAGTYADLFTEDGDVVNVLGWWWKGRAEIKAKLTQAFAFVFRDSQLKIVEVDVRLLAADIAIAHVRWEMEGAKAPAGTVAPPSKGIQMQVLKKLGDEWLIESFQNTNSIPETPFPAGPPRAVQNP